MAAAATVEPAATAAYTVKRSKVKYGDKVLIIGDGPIGLFAVQAAKTVGASMVMLIGSWPEKIEIALEIGADYGFSYRTGDAVDKAKEVMGDTQFDVIIETSGNSSSINQAIKLIKPSGTIGMVSFYGGPVEINMNDVITKDAELQGILASPNMFAPTLLAMSTGKIKAEPLITHIVDFEEINKGFQIAENREELSVKILVKMKD